MTNTMSNVIKKTINRLIRKPMTPYENHDRHHIPEELVLLILARLPVKALLRFKAVSKPWCAIISSPEFAKLRLIQSNSSLLSGDRSTFLTSYMADHKTSDDTILWNKFFLVTYNHCSHKASASSSVWREVRYFMDGQAEENLKLGGLPCVRLVGTCNGLVCLLTEEDTLMLWNPCTGHQCKIASRPEEIHYFMAPPDYRGLWGFFECDGGYKLLYVHLYDQVGKAYVYAIKNGDVSCRELTELGAALEHGPWYIYDGFKNSIFDGKSHWIMGTQFSQGKHSIMARGTLVF